MSDQRVENFKKLDGINILRIINMNIQISADTNVATINCNRFKYRGEFVVKQFINDSSPVNNYEDNVRNAVCDVGPNYLKSGWFNAEFNRL